MNKKILYFIGGILTAFAALLIAGPVQNARQTSSVSVVKKAGPAIVNISAEQRVSQSQNPFVPFGNDPFFNEFFRDFIDPRYGRKKLRQSLGSGVMIDPDGHILTNEHVILSNGTIFVTLMDGRSLPAELIGADSGSDIAVLKINGGGKLPFLAAGNSDDVMVGEPAIAIGNPFGLGQTVTVGVISATNRSIQTQERSYHDFLQTDASINPGNSGGPLLNALGQLIGINSAIYQKAQGIGFAIPINRARSVVEDLIRYGEVKVGWLGLQVNDLTDIAAQKLNYRGPGGVIVSLNFEGGPSQKASIRYGDVIEEMDGNVIRSKQDFRMVSRQITVGKKVRIKLNRTGNMVTTDVTAVEFPAAMADEIARYLLGIQVIPAPQGVKGVMIDKLAPGAAASRIGLRRGDIILKMNKDTTRNVGEWRKAASNIRNMDSVLLLVGRDRSVYYVILPISP